MIQPEKSCYSGNYKAEKKHINKGVELEHLKFDSDTGEIICHEQPIEKPAKTGNVTLWLIWIAILIGLCLATGAL